MIYEKHADGILRLRSHAWEAITADGISLGTFSTRADALRGLDAVQMLTIAEKLSVDCMVKAAHLHGPIQAIAKGADAALPDTRAAGSTGSRDNARSRLAPMPCRSARARRPRSSAAAERARRARARRRKGRAVFRVEASHDDTLLALMNAGRLTEEQGLCREAVEAALSSIVADFNVRWRPD
jgi:hypothetical protein